VGAIPGFDAGMADTPTAQRKMSEVLFEYVGEVFPGHHTEETLTKYTGLAALLWNIGLLPEERWKETLEGSLQALGSIPGPGGREQLTGMIRYRCARYGHDRRFIRDFGLTFENGVPRLTVESTG
jgi:hypothetical protein